MRRALGLSAAVHGVLAAVLLTLPARARPVDVPIEVMVDVVAEPPARPPEPAAVDASGAVPPRPVAIVRRARRVVSQPASSAPEPPPAAPQAAASAEAVQAEPAPEAPAPDAVAAAPVGDASSVGKGIAGTGTANGSSVVGAPGQGIQGTSGDGRVGGVHHRAAIDRYRAEVLRSRIAGVFQYPAEARDLELTGRVLLAVSIRGDGRLLDVRVAGRCPHTILCADGLRTVRAAAPFPALPPELGPSIVVEVPLTYTFE